MTPIFLNLLNVSIMAGWTVLAILLLRLVLRKAPKWTVCLLWAILAVRLLLPFSFESSLSLLPSAQVIPTDITQAEIPAIHSAIPELDSAVNPALLQSTTQEGSLEALVRTLSLVWGVGVAIMLVYSAISWLLLRLKVGASLHLQGNVYLCDNIQSPFVFGVIRPRIYVPSGLDGESLQHVLAHEKAHIQRKDHLWKPLGYLLLSFHWFNPLLWIGYILLCRDIERACDEKVLKKIGDAGKVGYANALLECSTHRRMILTCPVAFGEVSVASRVKSALHYKKPAFWIIAAALVVCAGLTITFLTVPKPCSHDYMTQLSYAPSCTHQGQEMHTCKKCEHVYATFVNTLPHTPGETKVIEDPTCSHEGKASAVCADCGGVYLQTLPKVADAHNMVETSHAESTCAQVGLVTYKCAYCDHQKKVEYPKKEHQYQQTILRQVTCEHSGKTENRCVHCGHTYTVTIPIEPHKWLSGHNGVLYCNSCFIQQRPSSDSSLTNNIADSKPTTSKFSDAQNDIMESIKTSLK